MRPRQVLRHSVVAAAVCDLQRYHYFEHDGVRLGDPQTIGSPEPSRLDQVLDKHEQIRTVGAGSGVRLVRRRTSS